MHSSSSSFFLFFLLIFLFFMSKKEVMALSNSDWAWLPKNLLDSVLVKLVLLSDYIRFSAVCKPWHSVAMENSKQRRTKTCHPHHVPMLMIPTKDNKRKGRSIYGITNGKVYDFELPVPHNRRCCGSSHGWLFHLDKEMALILSNPFSGDIICLPPFCDAERFRIERHRRNPNYHIRKAILSVDPSLSPNDYVVMVIYNCYHLAFIRSGDKNWTYLKIDWERSYYDVIYHKDKFHVVERKGRVSFYDFSCHELKVVAPAITINRLIVKIYLVESLEGDLLWVDRIMYYETNMTSRFTVRKLLDLDGQPKWVYLRSLGDCSLFLGDNHSISVQASDFLGCLPNSIYFTDDYLVHYETRTPYQIHGGCIDTGVYNLEDGSIKSHYTYNPSQRHMPPPIWIVPTFKENWF